ncbi:MAG: PP2C family serine/threonine-protein phosphatase [Planctomycetota bacterium]
MFSIRFYGRSDVGRKRLSNEDSYHTSDEDGFGIVCDGMGGHQGGEIASRLAVDVLTDSLARGGPLLARQKGKKLAHLRSLAKDMVLEWTQRANDEIFKQGGENTPLKTRMGTTLALVLLVEDFVVVAHVGDSRVYRIRDGAVERLTEDHSVIGPSRSPRAWGTAPKRRKFVTKALGTRSTVEPDIRLEDARGGDVFVLCSDGLSDAVKPEEMVEIVQKAGEDRRVALRSLVHLANKRGGRDNITVVLAEILQSAPKRRDSGEGSTEALFLPPKRD